MIHISAAVVISNDQEDGINNPKSFTAATQSPLAEKWETAYKEELDAISPHQVLGDFVELLDRRNGLPSHWVYKPKHDEAGNVQQFKARLVCGGNQLIEDIDYQATCAPTCCLGHVRLALAIAANYDLEIHLLVICTAILGVDLEDVIYMHLPQGYICLLQNGGQYKKPRFTKTLRKMELHLRRSLCRLKQS
jgi:hypothetical protein